MQSKILTLGESSQIAKKHGNKKIVLAGGCFDIFHFGHLTYLKKAKKEGDILVVALESDEFMIKNKKRTPIHTQAQRAELLASFLVVDYVINLPLIKGYKKYLQLVKEIRPSVIAITEGDPRVFEKTKQAVSIGAKLKVVCSLTSELSVSKIIKYASIFSN